MPIIRPILAVITGFVTWFVVATLGNYLVRALLPGYAVVEHSMTFTLSMMVARLGIGVVSSLVAGFACSAVARGSAAAVYIFAAVLLLSFLPVHYNLWHVFPVWYHVFFLVTLAPLVLLGAAVQRRQAAARQP